MKERYRIITSRYGGYYAQVLKPLYPIWQNITSFSFPSVISAEGCINNYRNRDKVIKYID